jgi:hypothetical protein
MQARVVLVERQAHLEVAITEPREVHHLSEQYLPAVVAVADAKCSLVQMEQRVQLAKAKVELARRLGLVAVPPTTTTLTTLGARGLLQMRVSTA